MLEKFTFKKLKFDHIVILSIIVYITAHLIEEGLFGFPEWALQYWGIPSYNFNKWLIHNYYFLACLMIGYFIYSINKKRFAVFGLGIVLWGFINALNHIIFTIIFFVYSPGLYTGFIFIFLTLLAFANPQESNNGDVKELDKISKKTIIFSIVIAFIFYWGVPIFTFIEIDKFLGI